MTQKNKLTINNQNATNTLRPELKNGSTITRVKSGKKVVMPMQSRDIDIRNKKKSLPTLETGPSGIDLDKEFFEITANHQSDPDAGIKLLEIIIAYLKSDQNLPWNIRDYLYSAFQQTVSAAPTKQAVTLTRALHITKAQGRPTVDDYSTIGEMVEKVRLESTSTAEAHKKVAAKTSLKLRSVREYHEQYLSDEKDFIAIERQRLNAMLENPKKERIK